MSASADATNSHIRFPFGSASVKTLSATGAQAITIEDELTVINGVSTVATGNRTIELTISSQLAIGAMILLKTKTTGTETTIFGTGIYSVTVSGAAGKTFSQGFIYDGTVFLPLGTAVQID